MKKTLIDYLETVTDFRNGNAIRHKLIDIMAIAILAVICGADYWTEIESFGYAKKEWLSKFLELPNGIPSSDTFGRVFASIDPKEFHSVFIEWVKSISDIVQDQVIAIDGKTARRTKDIPQGKKPLHVVSAWANENKLILGQMKVEEKSNEITAIPKLLNILDITGWIITIDAMGTQKKIAETIKNNEGDYILSLKENQGILYNDVKLYIEEEILAKSKKELRTKGQYYVTLDNDHGRYEKREYYICNDIDWMEQKAEWKGLEGIGVCVRECEEKGKKV